MSYGGFKCIEFPFYHVHCSWLRSAQRSHKGLSRSSNNCHSYRKVQLPRTKTASPRPLALCPSDTTRHVWKCISRSWVSCVNVSIAGASAPHTESLMAQGDSDRDGDYLCWHWTSSHDTALSPPPEIVRSQDTALVYTVCWPARAASHSRIIAVLSFPCLQLQIGPNLMKRWFKIPGWGSWMDWTRELITHQDLPARKQ